VNRQDKRFDRQLKYLEKIIGSARGELSGQYPELYPEHFGGDHYELMKDISKKLLRFAAKYIYVGKQSEPKPPRKKKPRRIIWTYAKSNADSASPPVVESRQKETLSPSSQEGES
jgi:hypothetical protein